MKAEEILEPCITFRDRHNIKCLKYDEAIMAINYYLESQPEQPREQWIDCNIKMPDGEVLLLTTSKVIILGDWYKDSWRTAQSYWDNGILKSVYQKEDITHWMPLPKTQSQPKPKPDTSQVEGMTAGKIYEWLKSKKYQTEYSENGEYKMYFEIDMPKILSEYASQQRVDIRGELIRVLNKFAIHNYNDTKTIWASDIESIADEYLKIK